MPTWFRRSTSTALTAAALVTLSYAQSPAPDGSSGPAAQPKKALPRKGLAKQGLMPRLQGLKVDRDLTYARIGDRALALDLYRPDDSTDARRPLVVWIHGGGWRSGTKFPTQAALLARDGYVVASVEYRLSGEAAFPAQIEDCRAAIRWLRASAARYGIDPDRVGVWGASAGGHLVALLGTAGDVKAWDVGAHTDQSSRVQAVCDYYGPSDFTEMPARQAAKADGPVALLLGGPISEKRDLARAASPVTHVDRDDPPFLIVHGTADPVVPIRQSEKLHAALRAAGAASTLIKVERAGHGFNAPDLDVDPPPTEIQRRVRAFFDEHLKAASPAG